MFCCATLLACGPTSTPKPQESKLPAQGKPTPADNGPIGVGKVIVKRDNALVVYSLTEKKELRSIPLGDNAFPFVGLSEDGTVLTTKDGIGGCVVSKLSDDSSTSCTPPGAVLLNFVFGAGAAAGRTYHAYLQGEQLLVASLFGGVSTTIGEWDTSTLGPITNGVVSRDGSRFVLSVFADDDRTGKYLSFGAAGVPPEVLVDLGARTYVGYCSHIALSRDGKRFAYCDGESSQTPSGVIDIKLHVRDLQTSTDVVFADGVRFGLSPDGERIVWTTSDNKLRVSSVAGPFAPVIIGDELSIGGQIVFTTDGKRVLVDVDDQGIVSYDAATLGDARVVFAAGKDDSPAPRLFTDYLAGTPDLTSN